jgi:hypothetical protein
MLHIDFFWPRRSPHQRDISAVLMTTRVNWRNYLLLISTISLHCYVIKITLHTVISVYTCPYYHTWPVNLVTNNKSKQLAYSYDDTPFAICIRYYGLDSNYLKCVFPEGYLRCVLLRVYRLKNTTINPGNTKSKDQMYKSSSVNNNLLCE